MANELETKAGKIDLDKVKSAGTTIKLHYIKIGECIGKILALHYNYTSPEMESLHAIKIQGIKASQLAEIIMASKIY